jgi:hypothetical protein
MATKTDKTTKPAAAKAPKAATTKKGTVAAPKAAKAEKAAHKTASPFNAVKDKHGGKEKLAKTLSSLVDDDTEVIAARLQKSSNKQLLRLHAVSETVKRKFGSRDKLIAKLAAGKTKDKDYVAKLGSYSLPRLLDLARGI